MAGGKRHAKSTKRNLKWMLPVGSIASLADPNCLGFLLGAIIGHVLTPDIDHHFYTYEEYRIYRYNRILGFLWWLYWLPYEKLVPHRGISHQPIVGTATRFFYLLWFPLLYFDIPTLFLFYVFIAWAIQDFTHLRLDRKRKKWKRPKELNLPLPWI